VRGSQLIAQQASLGRPAALHEAFGQVNESEPIRLRPRTLQITAEERAGRERILGEHREFSLAPREIAGNSVRPRRSLSAHGSQKIARSAERFAGERRIKLREGRDCVVRHTCRNRGSVRRRHDVCTCHLLCAVISKRHCHSLPRPINTTSLAPSTTQVIVASNPIQSK